MKAIIYTRTSWRPAPTESCEAQLKQCRDFCSMRGWEIEHEFVERETSGANLTARPIFLRALKAARKPDHVLVATTLSRVSRSVRDLLDIIDDLGSARACIVVLEMPEMDTTRPTSWLTVSIIALLAEYQRVHQAMVTSQAMLAHQAMGRRMGKNISYGWDIHPDDSSRIIEVHEEQTVIQKIIGWHKDGRTTRWIAGKLNSHGIPYASRMWTRRHNGEVFEDGKYIQFPPRRWTSSHVWRLLRKAGCVSRKGAVGRSHVPGFPGMPDRHLRVPQVEEESDL